MLVLSYSGKRALILGGSCEMGLALAEAMTASDLFPLLTYRDPGGRARIDKRLGPPGSVYDAVHLDLRAPMESNRLQGLLSQGVEYLVDLAHGDFEGYVAAVDGSVAGEFFHSHIPPGLATSPLIPQSCVICPQLPRAPESIM